MAKIGKTERAILDRIKNSPYETTVVQSGLSRGRGRTGKLRPYGDREYNAMMKLVGAGMIVIVKRETSQTYHKGYSETHTDFILKLPLSGE